MSSARKSQTYRDVIDELVRACQEDQGQIGANRVRAGEWNQNATADFLPDQHAINLLLKRMPAEDREIVANMLANEVVVGVFESLKALEQFGVTPFEDGYEGSPFNDFIGRLGGWEWPKE